MSRKRILKAEQYENIFKHVFFVPRYGSNELVPFVLNKAQKELLYNFADNNIILKSRKLGFTTVIAAFWIVTCNEFKDTHVAFIANNDANTLAIFEKIKSLITKCNPEFKGFEDVKVEKRRIEFPNGSVIDISTAGRQSAFRGGDLHGIHCSEVAFFEYPEVFDAVIEAAGKGVGVVFLESTANGRNFFYDLWERSSGYPKTCDFKPFFYGWHQHPDNFVEVPPQFKKTKEEEELAIEYKINDSQVAWRRWKLNSMINPDKFPQEHPITASEAFISTGSPVFSLKMLESMKQVVSDYRQGELIYNKSGEVVFNDKKTGNYKIYKLPSKNKMTVIGADCAEGVAGGDFNAACVLDVESKEQVAQYHGICDPDQFAYELNKLGLFYSTGLMMPERNNSGYTVISALVNDYNYPNMYQETTPQDEMFTSPTEKLGFRTNVKSRSIIIDLAKEYIRKGYVKINSVELLNELNSFIYTKSGKPQHDSGKHDDLVFAFMIALFGLTEYDDVMTAKIKEDNSLYNQIYKKRNKKTKPVKKSIAGY